MYAVIDIETTGTRPYADKITEIAILLYDGQQVVDRFASLINPERFIPEFITKLTGISNEMVADAPKFYEIAKQILRLTEGRLFVAHNANFDYNFIKAEFKSLGYQYTRKTLCTVKMSRQIIPGYRSYSLGKLCAQLGIVINDRHRAEGDAEATVKLLDHLLTVSGKDQTLLGKLATSLENLRPPNLPQETLDKLPEATGVYYFRDRAGDLLYIGKSINISKRVVEHLHNRGSQRAVEMCQKIADIDYELTGSELVALLLESDEIKKHKPLYNRAQRRGFFTHGLYSHIDEAGYHCLTIERNGRKKGIPAVSFTSLAEAKEHLSRLCESFSLCQKLVGLYPTEAACFHYHIGQCHGACIGEENPDAYNLRVAEALQTYAYQHDSFLIVDQGRHADEKAIIKIANGKYMGFGYIDSNLVNNNIDLLTDCIHPYTDNRDVQQIIRYFMRQKKIEQVIEYNDMNL